MKTLEGKGISEKNKLKKIVHRNIELEVIKEKSENRGRLQMFWRRKTRKK